MSSLLGALLFGCLVATSIAETHNIIPISTLNQHLQHPLLHHLSAAERTFDAPKLAEWIMYGLAGIPLAKAIGFIFPFLKINQNKQKDTGRVLNRRRSKRDLAYAQQLLELLISVENSLEKYGVTEPQCQLQATCEIFKGNTGIKFRKSDRVFIKLVNEMRKEIRNPKVVPLAKYVFEYYEEAAIRGEQQCNCREKYPQCDQNLDYLFKRTKGRRPTLPVNKNGDSNELNEKWIKLE